MNYQKIYNALIEKYKNIQVEGYVEKHHIIPKCMGGNNTEENLVKLSPKAHFVAHHLLHKIYPTNRKLASAFGMMICGTTRKLTYTAKMYDAARKVNSLAKRGKSRPDLAEINRRRRKPPKEKIFKQRKNTLEEYNLRKKLEGFTPEEIENKRKAGRARKGVVMSEEGRKSCRIAALKRAKTAPIIVCFKCGHKQKRSPNFYRYHNDNCFI